MAQKIKKSRRRRTRPKPPIVGLSPEELDRTCERMEIYDSLNYEERMLVKDYGLAKAYNAIRQFYGRPAAARAYLEAERQALQVARWRNTR